MAQDPDPTTTEAVEDRSAEADTDVVEGELNPDLIIPERPDPEQAWPPGRYVSPGGSNQNGGTSPEDAWGSLPFAVKQLQPGDTLWLLDGTYTEEERTDSAVVMDVSGTEDAWIRITAFPGTKPVLSASHSNGIKVEGASYVEISDLTIVGAIETDKAPEVYTGAGINVDSIYSPTKNHHVRILRNTISGFGAGGVPVTGTTHVEIRDNVIFDVASVELSQHSGISLFEPENLGLADDENGYSNYITGNLIYQVENTLPSKEGVITDGNCIILDRTDIRNYTGRTLIANNVCLDNGGRGIQIFESGFVDVVNNTVYHNLRTPEIAKDGGELGSVNSHDVVFANNLVFARDGLVPVLNRNSNNVRFQNNLYASDTTPLYASAAVNGDQMVDPSAALVENASTEPNIRNFMLSSESLALNAGVRTFASILETDALGAQRQSGGGVDVGALERE